MLHFCINIDGLGYICKQKNDTTHFTNPSKGHPCMLTFTSKGLAEQFVKENIEYLGNKVKIQLINIVTFTCALTALKSHSRFNVIDGELKLDSGLDTNAYLRIESEFLNVTGTKGQVLTILQDLDLATMVKKTFSNHGVVSVFKDTIVFLYQKFETNGMKLKYYKVLDGKGNTIAHLHIPDEYFQ